MASFDQAGELEAIQAFASPSLAGQASTSRAGHAVASASQASAPQASAPQASAPQASAPRGQKQGARGREPAWQGTEWYEAYEATKAAWTPPLTTAEGRYVARVGGDPGPVAVDDLQPQKVYPPIEQVQNDGLTPRAMLSYISASVDQRGLVGHNLKGYNELITHGIERIMTDLFDVTRPMRNDRTQTESDRQRKSFQIQLKFSDVKVGSPLCTEYKTGQFQPLLPNYARLTSLPYSGVVTLRAQLTVKAFNENGSVEVKTGETSSLNIGSFPTMVKGVNCHTSALTRAGLKENQEDPNDPGGYFIAKGGEYVVDLLENICYNRTHIHRAMKPNEYVRAEFLSQPGGAFENSSQIRVRYMTSGQITVEITSTKYAKARLPFFLVYRLFGMTNDQMVAEAITLDRADAPGSAVRARMLDVLEQAFQLADDSFKACVGNLNREQLVQKTAEQLSKFLTNPQAYQSDEHAIQFLNEDLLGSENRPGGLDRAFLPHMGQTAESRVRKLRFLGLIIHKMLLVHQGALPPTDRDSYRNKRVHGSGVSLAKAFKTQVNNSIVSPLCSSIMRELKNNPWEAITDKTLADTFRNALKTADLNRAMEQSITSGVKTIIVRRRAATNRVSSQALERKNMLNTFSALRGVTTQNTGNTSKATERADRMRRVHPTYTGFLCVAQSPDTGENVGKRKQLAITAGVCTAGEAYPLKMRLLADPAVTPLDKVASRDLVNLSRVFVNGEWIGVCDEAHKLVGRYRALRREMRLVDPFTTIYWDPLTDEVEFWLDVGRLYRPLLIVDNNLPEYNAACYARFAAEQAGAPLPAKVEFVQNVRFTPEHVRLIAEGRLTLSELVRDGIAEYITPEEQENCLLAESVATLRAARNDVTRRFTHCDVEQAIFGLAAHLSPFGNHTQPARVTYETNQGRQTGGWYAMNFPWRTDKNRFFQFYNEMPLVRTITHKLVPPNGTNVVIAYASYGGDNQEDSAIVSQASADRGMFSGALFRYERAELEKGDAFCNPDPLTTKNLKPNACYEKLVDGFIRVGSRVVYGDVIIGRVAKLPPSRAAGDRYTFTDRSVIYRLQEPALVEEVLTPRGANDEKFGVVKLRYERPLRTGDKLSSRSGNKCLTPDHEVLTARGWVPVALVAPGDYAACLLPAGDDPAGPLRATYRPVQATHSYAHDGVVYCVDAPGVSLRTTLNHRMLVRADSAGESAPSAGDRVPLAGGRAYRVALAGELVGSHATYAAGDPYTNPADGIAGLLPPGSDTGLLPPSSDTGLLPAGSDAGLLPPGSDAGLLPPSSDAGLLPPSSDAAEKQGLLPPGIWAAARNTARALYDALAESGRLASLAPADAQRLALHAGRGECEPSAPVGATRVAHYRGPVHCITVPGGYFYVRRATTAGPAVWTGNSIVASMLQQSDMPFTQSGMTPDIVINTHSFPSRMTIGQLIETSISKVCARKGVIADGTAFLPVDHESIAADLHACGFRYNGRERMYNGMTGEYFDAAIFIGFTDQQRLQKFVLDDEQAVAGTGPTDATTGQPLGGKHFQGGLRLGEMEIWGLSSHGCTLNLHEKTHTDSDGRTMNVCRGCGALATFNEYQNIYSCQTCGEQADISTVESSKSAILLHEELAAANINMKLGLRPREYAE
jgi:DNA-directed RNA polymerase beta subunit